MKTLILLLTMLLSLSACSTINNATNQPTYTGQPPKVYTVVVRVPLKLPD